MASLGVAFMVSSPSMAINGNIISQPSAALWSRRFKIFPKQNISILQRIPLKSKHGTVCAISSDAHGDKRMKGISNTGKDGPLMIKYSGEKPPTPLLDTINYPIHMKNFNIKELRQFAKELREEIIFSAAKTGGHLSASLGVVDLTVALHYVFNTPHDKIVWHVGHQSYPHKILTERRSRMGTMRQTSGLAGFPRRVESEHDAFGAGHSSTSISAAVGMAVGRDLLGKHNHVIAVIGDGALTAGQAYEAMNNAGFLDSNMIIILNDNKQVSLPTATIDGPAPQVGALCRLQASKKFRQLRELAKDLTHQIGGATHQIAAKVDEYARGTFRAPGSALFEELGLYYIGPVDGHNIQDLVAILENVKSMPAPGPILIHVVTEKGKGYPPAEKAADKLNGVVKFDRATGKQFKPKSSTLSYTQYFAEGVIAEAERDEKIVAIHAAMGGGTGLNYFQKRFPERCFDVGIAEQHAVTFAAGLATEGLKPFCAIYSSFLQRGYDQIGKGRILAEGTHIAILGYGSIVQNCLAAREMLAQQGISVTVADARFCKPLDGDLIRRLVKEHEILVTVEEGSIGGFGSHVSHFLALHGLFDGKLKWRPMVLPDRYIDHGSPKDQIE